MDLDVYGHTEDDTKEEGGIMKRVKGQKRYQCHLLFYAIHLILGSVIR